MSKPATITKRVLVGICLLLMAVLFFGYFVPGLAQESKINFNALINETQKLSEDPDKGTFVWWIPVEYWSVNAAQDPTISDAVLEDFTSVLGSYIFIAAMDGKIGPFGGVTYISEKDIRAGIRIRDNQGQHYGPLRENKIDPDTKNLLLALKPVLENMLGPTGANLHFFLFPAKTKKGRSIADATKEGSFSIKVGDEEFTWRLPLGSLLAPKICPKCTEGCSGAWNYCPWCGTTLPKQD